MVVRLKHWAGVGARWAVAAAVVALPHGLGLVGLGLVALGFAGWLGWPAAMIVAGAPFAGFWIWGESIRVMREWRSSVREG